MKSEKTKEELHMEKSDKHYFKLGNQGEQMVSGKSYWYHVSFYDVMRMVLGFSGLPLKTHYSCVLMRKHQANPSRGTFYKTSEQYPQNSQGHQKQGTSEKCHSQEKPKEIWLLNVM